MPNKCNAVLNAGFAVVFYNLGRTLAPYMSLNRSEQLLYDYIQQHREERQFWQDKVQAIVIGSAELPSASARLDSELWRYFGERSSVVPSFASAVHGLGHKRLSMKNLAEFLIRVWTEAKPRKPAAQDSTLR